MAIEQIVPKTAHDRMTDSADAATYLDVRTVEEYEAGHPAGAHNVPVMNRVDGQMTPNPHFAEEVQNRFGMTDRLVVGCMAGGRSQKACEILQSAGFTRLANVQGGFGGARDASGQIAVKGWSQEGLPTESGRPAGRAYGKT